MKDWLVLCAIGFVSVVVILVVAFLLLGQQARIARTDHTSPLPAVNAFLNGTSAVLLTVGYFFIRRKKVRNHQMCMVTAFLISCLFLICYLVHHYQVGSTPFPGWGWVRPLYFTLLISHIILAALIVPLALTALYRALNGQFDKHVKITRWALPIWLYVSVSGVIVYFMLYHLYPPR